MISGRCPIKDKLENFSSMLVIKSVRTNFKETFKEFFENFSSMLSGYEGEQEFAEVLNT